MCVVTLAGEKVERPLAVSVEDAEDVLYDEGASLDLVKDWGQREERSFEAVGTCESLPPHLRGVALAFLAWLTKAMKIPSSGYFSAVALVDGFGRRAGGGLSAGRLPRVCAAAVSLERKLDTCRPAARSAHLATYATQFSLWLRQMGHHDTPEKITAEHIEREERLLLDSMEWQIGAPTVESWFTLLVQRFNVFTQGAYVQQLNRASQRSLLCAWALVGYGPSSPELPPRAMARGLLSMALAAEGLLPTEALPEGANAPKGACSGVQQLVDGVKSALRAAADASWDDLCASHDLAAAAVQKAALASMGKAGATEWSPPAPHLGGA